MKTNWIHRKPNMMISVRFSEPYWRNIGKRTVDINISGEGSITRLFELIAEKHPSFAADVEQYPPLIFRGEDQIERETTLFDKDIIHLMWPITGGQVGF